MKEIATITLDGEVYTECDAAHVDSIVYTLEMDGISIADETWTTTSEGRYLVELTTESEAD
jgi:hypothetical protein